MSLAAQGWSSPCLQIVARACTHAEQGRVTVSPPGVGDPFHYPASLQVVNNVTGITANAVVQIGTFELPAVQ
jgi:hypothetical protein